MPFTFLAGNLALDFVATVASRDTVAKEWLPDAAAFAEWLVLSAAVTEPPRVSPAEFTEAVLLRETIYRALRGQVSGDLDPDGIAGINAAAAIRTPVPSLIDGRIRIDGSAPECLALIARAAQRALTDPRLRFCAGSDCTRPFIDASRAGTRRWCGMAGCGDRAKSAAYRRRASTHRRAGARSPST